MSFNVNWPRYIMRSVMLYLDTNMTDIVVIIEGQTRNTDDLKEYIELRMDGPWARALQDNYWDLEFDINVLCTVDSDDNLYRMEDITGKLANLLSQKVSIYEDDKVTEIGCTQIDTDRRKRLQINNFGVVKPGSTIKQSTVETRHIINLKGV